MSEYKYQYTSVRGLERRKIYSAAWENVNGAVLEEMTADELRKCADVMDAEPSDGPTNPPRPVDALIPTTLGTVANRGDKQKWWRLGYTRKRKESKK